MTNNKFNRTNRPSTPPQFIPCSANALTEATYWCIRLHAYTWHYNIRDIYIYTYPHVSMHTHIRLNLHIQTRAVTGSPAGRWPSIPSAVHRRHKMDENARGKRHTHLGGTVVCGWVRAGCWMDQLFDVSVRYEVGFLWILAHGYSNMDTRTWILEHGYSNMDTVRHSVVWVLALALSLSLD